MADDQAARVMEQEALSAIFGEDFVSIPNQGCCEITLACPSQHLEHAKDGPSLVLSLGTPEEYPSRLPPTVLVKDAFWLPESERLHLEDAAREHVLSIFMDRQSQGGDADVMLFEVIEFVKDQSWVWRHAEEILEENRSALEEQNERKQAEQKERERRQHAEEENKQEEERRRASSADHLGADEGNGDHSASWLDREQALGIQHGEPVTVRKSVFQAHLAPVASTDGVKSVMDVLLANRKIASATHNIMAYRIKSASGPSTTVLQDWDDDGESAAGGRLLHLLQVVGATNVVVVVSRWFGGILLGPERFRHINNSARNLLSIHGYCSKEGK